MKRNARTAGLSRVRATHEPAGRATRLRSAAIAISGPGISGPVVPLRPALGLGGRLLWGGASRADLRHHVVDDEVGQRRGGGITQAAAVAVPQHVLHDLA